MRLFDLIVKLLFAGHYEDSSNSSLHCYCLGLDVVEYSKKTSDIQIATIKKINKAVKESVALREIEPENIIYLPTGDGVIICLTGSYSNPLVLIRLAKELQLRIKEENAKVDSEEQFAIRMGLHSGTGILLRDINGMRNIAGSVINMTQRIMDKGEEWHILASKNAFYDIGSMDKVAQKYFLPLGLAEAKHKITLEFFNVCCDKDGDMFGNKARPSGFTPAHNEVETGVVGKLLDSDYSS